MYTLGAGRILIKSIIIMCLLNLLAWKASWAHRTGENEEKKDSDKIKSRSKHRAPVVGVRSSLGSPCCVLEQDTFTSQKVLIIPRKRSLRPDMTVKLFTGTLNKNKTK